MDEIWGLNEFKKKLQSVFVEIIENSEEIIKYLLIDKINYWRLFVDKYLLTGNQL